MFFHSMRRFHSTNPIPLSDLRGGIKNSIEIGFNLQANHQKSALNKPSLVIECEIEIHPSHDLLIEEVLPSHVENCRLVSSNQKLYSREFVGWERKKKEVDYCNLHNVIVIAARETFYDAT